MGQSGKVWDMIRFTRFGSLSMGRETSQACDICVGHLGHETGSVDLGCGWQEGLGVEVGGRENGGTLRCCSRSSKGLCDAPMGFKIYLRACSPLPFAADM